MKTKESMHLNAKVSTFRNAEKLRNRLTASEKILWEELRKRKLIDLKFRRQHPISRYVLDFYCHEAKLGIELDGKYHEKKSQQLYDKDRTENLEKYNIQIIRFTNDDVINSLQKVLNRIQEACELRISLLKKKS